MDAYGVQLLALRVVLGYSSLPNNCAANLINFLKCCILLFLFQTDSYSYIRTHKQTAILLFEHTNRQTNRQTDRHLPV